MRRAFGVLVLIFSACFVACASTCVLQCDVLAFEPRAPVIAAFERFARHNELTPQASGNLLLSELSCTSCHTSQQPDIQPKAGPNLNAVGRRLNTAWIASFLNAPSAVKPGTTMPDVLGHLNAQEKQHSISALVAFLSNQQTPHPELKASGLNPVPHEFWNKGDLASGERLYHQVGCVACHEPAANYGGGVKSSSSLNRMLEELDPEDIARLGLTHATRSIISIPLPNTHSKYTRQGLTRFLLDPALARPAGRMPNMKLGITEAADIATYLIERDSDVASGTTALEGAATASGATTAVATGQPSSALRAEGQRLFSELGCVQCHTATDAFQAADSKPLVSLNPLADRSCISETRHASAPHYALDALQREGLQAALKESERAVNPINATNAKIDSELSLKLELMRLNCFACHERDKAGGIAHGRDGYFETVGQVDLGDEGRLPPALTGVGNKLNTSWMKHVLAGTGDIRPHLQIRMPKYPPAEVEPLVPMFAAVDARTSTSVNYPSQNVNRTLADAGRAIFNVGCVQCHPVRGEALPSVVGVDIGHIGIRVRPQWFHDFLLDPASLKPRTRMPTFFAEGSVSQEHLNGNVEQQIAALWAYLEDVDRQPLPEKIELVRRQNFELVPQDRPILLRTFMERAGTHAIAVGFPEKVNFAFDAETVHLSDMWRGRFLDAQGTWNDRFAPHAIPLSRSLSALPPGAEFALLNSPNALWPNANLGPMTGAQNQSGTARFRGYRLDEMGVPEFEYQVGDYAIVDRITPSPLLADDKDVRPGLLREFTIKLAQPVAAQDAAAQTQRLTQRLWFRVAAGNRLLRPDEDACTTDSGLTVLLPIELASTAVMRQSNGLSMWLAPLPPAAETNFTIEYRW